MNIIFAYIAALVTLTALDAGYFSITKGFVTKNIGHLMSGQINWWAVALFYIFYAAAVVYFTRADSWQEAALRGAALGFTAYMTFDLVNLGVLKDYPVPFAVIDIIWGTIMTVLAAAIVSFVI